MLTLRSDMRCPQGGAPELYRAALEMCAWAEIGPYLLHDARMAAAYRHGDDSVASIIRAETVEELEIAGHPYAVLTVDAAAERIRGDKTLPLHPRCGGMPPQLAWPYLHRAAAAVSAARSAAE